MKPKTTIRTVTSTIPIQIMERKRRILVLYVQQQVATISIDYYNQQLGNYSKSLMKEEADNVKDNDTMTVTV
jgi:hypothetical protein